ncbi:hypothetical protein HFO94_06560 [Rhizobium leguminosarum]|uniref:hypothetical protein n=1 Tax=Rhizobium TaxID=379 RepID=UPI0014792208|nr:MULTISPECIES: hypothetical protein [Rhizobium]MBY5353203.1 hypothetical protein [Rhizobium leguminosarum]NNH43619.1 hypothetical protein [Rhizobium laguerreae]
MDKLDDDIRPVNIEAIVFNESPISLTSACKRPGHFPPITDIGGILSRMTGFGATITSMTEMGRKAAASFNDYPIPLFMAVHHP